MATSDVKVTEGSGKNVATYSFTEDTETKQIQRIVVNNSSGTELGSASTPIQVSLANTGSNATAVKTDNSGVTQPVSGTLTVQQSTASSLKVDLSGTSANSTAIKVDNSAVNQPVVGPTASGSSLTGNPITAGGLAKTANPTAVSDGQVVNSTHDKLGRQVVVLGNVRDLKGNQLTTITSSTSETTVVTAVASTFLDVYGCIVENTSATATKVTFKDSTSGTTQFEIYVPAGDTRGFMLPSSDAFKQTTVNNNWTATCGNSVASIVITMLYVKNT